MGKHGSERDALLVLGGSFDQLPAVVAAKGLGIPVVVVDRNPASPAFAHADHHGVVSTRDIASLLKFVDDCDAAGRRIGGVLVMGSDIPEVGAAVAAHVGCRSIPMEAALLTTDKFRMKTYFQERGLPVPWFSPVISAADVVRLLATRDGKFVLKPVDSSGARGVFQVERDSDLDSLFEESRAISRSGQVMIEEYLDGPQLSTETVVYRGEAYTVGLADRNYEMLEQFAPRIIENGGWIPSSISNEARTSVESLMRRVAKALGISYGILKGDIVLMPSGPVVIEVATRMSGGDFSASLIPLSSGIRLIEAAILISMGHDIDLSTLQPRWSRAVINRYFFPPSGRLVKLEGVERVRGAPGVEKVEFGYRVGDVIPTVKSHADRFGVFVVSGETRDDAEARARWVYENVHIEVERN